MKPVVSILMPSYNYETYIGQAIESVLHQTFHEWELIIIDDGSKDKSIKKIKEFKDNRIVLKTQKNQGVTVTLNKALSLARGDYICFLDADDKYHPDKLKKQVELIQKGFDIVTTKVQAIDSYGENLEIEHFKNTWNNFDTKDIFGERKVSHFLKRNYLCKSATMVRKSLFKEFGDFRTDLRTAYDLELWLRMLQNARLARCNETLTFYRWHDKNESIINNSRIKMELVLISDYYICNQLQKNQIKKQALKEQIDSINSLLIDNGLYKGFLTLQIIKNIHNIRDSFRTLKDTHLINLLVESFTIGVPQQKSQQKENFTETLRRCVIPYPVRRLLKIISKKMLNK